MSDSALARGIDGAPAGAAHASSTEAPAPPAKRARVADGAPSPFALLGEPLVGCAVLEAVLSAGCGELARSILSFLMQEEALPLRAASCACREAVAGHAWDVSSEQTAPYYDLFDCVSSSRIRGSLASWRRCFLRATHADFSNRKRWYRDVTDADMVHLSGIHTLGMSWSTRITDAGLAHLRGIHTLDMSRCTLVTDASLAHLSGIHTLGIGGCPQLTAAALQQLAPRRLHS